MPADPSDDCFRGYTGRAARVGVPIVVRADLNPVKVRAKWRIIATELAIGGAMDLGGERPISDPNARIKSALSTLTMTSGKT